MHITLIELAYMKMSDSVYREIRRAYSDQFQLYGDSPKGVYWNDTDTQFLRYKVLCRNLLIEKQQDRPPVIHDVGCGTGALHEYLVANGIEHEYVGTEMVSEMAEVCRKKIPTGAIFGENFLDQTEGQWDFVISSGSCNLRGKVDPEIWHANMLQLIDKMYKSTTRAIAFNFLTSRITIKADPTLHYVNPPAIFEYCRRNLSRFVILDQGYPLFEATVTVYKPEYIQSKNPEPGFTKYFSPEP